MSGTGRAALATAFSDLRPAPRIVTIGTFDGVHLGHQRLLDGVVTRARRDGLLALAVTFEPLPALVLRPDRFPGRVCSVEYKFAELAESGLDEVLTLTFTRAFAQQSPEGFMATLAQATRLRELWVGEAFALGKDRVGDVSRLTDIGHRLGFRVVAIPRLAIEGEIVSSSAIRSAVRAGEAARARGLLGRPFRVSGEVIHGAHFGRTIGFPTANIEPPPDLVPLADGIYVSHGHLPGDPQRYPAMTYVGTRPTVNTGARLIETHLLDFDGDLYGQTIAVDVLERLRGDATFDGVPAMVAQLRLDERAARTYFDQAGFDGRLARSEAS